MNDKKKHTTDTPPFPVEKYRIVARSLNSVAIQPFVGKKFTGDEVSSIVDWSQENGFHSSPFLNGGVHIIGTRSSIKRVPEPNYVTVAEQKRIVKEEERQQARNEREVSQKEYIDSSPAKPFINHYFPSLGLHNKHALARYLTGDDNVFDGLLNRQCASGVASMGIPLQSGVDILLRVKEKYSLQSEIKPLDLKEPE